MPETERRFLIDDIDAAIASSVRQRTISQSYVPETGGWAIRLRTIAAGDARVRLLTMKMPLTLMTADEHETEVSDAFHAGLLPRCGPSVDKLRRDVPEGSGLVWEVDVFHAPELRLGRSDGRTEPLTLAEIELPDETHRFERPAWLGIEVTDDKAFSNFQLAARIARVRTLVAGGMPLDEAIAANLLEEPS